MTAGVLAKKANPSGREGGERACLRRIIGGALEGKYSGVDAVEVRRLVEASYTILGPLRSAPQIAKQVRPLDGPESDIWNQTCTLLLIERKWRSKLPSGPIKCLHRALGFGFGASSLRNSVHVPDFGGAPPTAPQDVGGALHQMELAMEQLAPGLRNSNVVVQSRFLAYLVASIIRVHPFEDGNGRAARMVVQLCVRLWGLPFVPLPKVRNDKKWRRALTRAVEGRIDMLSAELQTRIDGARGAR